MIKTFCYLTPMQIKKSHYLTYMIMEGFTMKTRQGNAAEFKVYVNEYPINDRK